jgi:hypothetical protein
MNYGLQLIVRPFLKSQRDFVPQPGVEAPCRYLGNARPYWISNPEGVASVYPMIAIGLDDERAQGSKRHLVMQKSKDKDDRDEPLRSSHLPADVGQGHFRFMRGTGIRAIFQVRNTKAA